MKKLLALMLLLGGVFLLAPSDLAAKASSDSSDRPPTAFSRARSLQPAPDTGSLLKATCASDSGDVCVCGAGKFCVAGDNGCACYVKPPLQ